MKNIAVIFAGGYGVRMQKPGMPKQFLEANGKPVIIYTLEIFEHHPQIDAICVSCIESWIPNLERLIQKYGIRKVVSVVPGGPTGQDSIYNGLCAARQYAEACKEADAFVLIHDGVRPLELPETVSANLQIAHEHGNCITCVPATETIVIAPQGGQPYVPGRNESFLARAPQTFRLFDILAAQTQARKDGRHDYIDSSTLMHHYGHRLYSCIGSYENIKITTPTDFFIFRAILKMREDQQAYGI